MLLRDRDWVLPYGRREILQRGLTPLHLACRRPDISAALEIIPILVKGGANIHAKNKVSSMTRIAIFFVHIAYQSCCCLVETPNGPPDISICQLEYNHPPIA
jgi:hypothetical protein